MFTDFIKYGAVSAKARAMYGKRITEEELVSLAAMTSLRQLAAFLKQHPGWAGIFSRLEDVSPNRGKMELLLKNAVCGKYYQLSRFIGGSDERFYRAWTLSLEIDVALGFVSRLNAGHPEEYAEILPERILSLVKLDAGLLARAKSYGELCAAFAPSPLAGVLAGFAVREGEPVDYTALELALTSYFMKNLYDAVKRNYSGGVMLRLLKNLGVRADTANIVRTLRLRSFLSGAEQLPKFLIPYFYKIKNQTLRELFAAKNGDEIEGALEKTPYSSLYDKRGARYFERYYYEFHYRFYKKILYEGTPSVLTPLAYLELLQTEVRNLTHIIECVRYGLPRQEAEKYLTGLAKNSNE